MKFAYLILGEFVYPQDSAAIHGETAQIIGVSNLEEACACLLYTSPSPRD